MKGSMSTLLIITSPAPKGEYIPWKIHKVYLLNKDKNAHIYTLGIIILSTKLYQSPTSDFNITFSGASHAPRETVPHFSSFTGNSRPNTTNGSRNQFQMELEFSIKGSNNHV